MIATVGQPLLWTFQLVTGAQVEAKIQVRKLKKDLRLENMWLFTTMLASGLAVKVEE